MVSYQWHEIGLIADSSAADKCISISIWPAREPPAPPRFSRKPFLIDYALLLSYTEFSKFTILKSPVAIFHLIPMTDYILVNNEQCRCVIDFALIGMWHSMRQRLGLIRNVQKHSKFGSG